MNFVNAKNPYIGDASANGRILRLLNFNNIQLNGTELQTTTEPYELIVDLKTDKDTDFFINHFENSSQFYKNAAIILSLIDNCQNVSYRFNNSQTITFTREQIENNFGYDVRLMTQNIDEFKAFLNSIETAEDYSDIIEKLHILSTANEKADVNDIIKNNSDYEYLIKYGNKTVNYALRRFEQEVKNDLENAVMAKAVYEILGIQCSENPDDYPDTTKWYNALEIRNEITLKNSFRINTDNLFLKEVYNHIDLMELMKSSYYGFYIPAVNIIDSIEKGDSLKLFVIAHVSYFKAYEGSDGLYIKRVAGNAPTGAYTLKKETSGEYSVTDFKKIEDGGLLAPSLKEMCVDFDGKELPKVYEKMFNSANYYAKDLDPVMEENLMKHLSNNGISKNQIKDIQ